MVLGLYCDSNKKVWFWVHIVMAIKKEWIWVHVMAIKSMVLDSCDGIKESMDFGSKCEGNKKHDFGFM
jgi:hypothetical protein